MRNVFTSRNVYAFTVAWKLYYVKRFFSPTHFPTAHRQVDSRIQSSNGVECGYSRFQDTQRVLSWPVHEYLYRCHYHSVGIYLYGIGLVQAYSRRRPRLSNPLTVQCRHACTTVVRVHPTHQFVWEPVSKRVSGFSGPSR